ncbi:hypothetical protein HanRHA438_Chr15g0732121 [Helianthus annuus]|nr:hypothetical protein HanIR_Chr15g0783271 [Helianthus annuus]KAJ0847079.1 hypothetical protein HanRHA438_Chr15g0732121 [Helianthus annuus]
MYQTSPHKESLHPVPTTNSVSLKTVISIICKPNKTNLHLPRKPVINSHNSQRSDSKCRHNSSHKVSKPLRFLPLHFLLHRTTIPIQHRNYQFRWRRILALALTTGARTIIIISSTTTGTSTASTITRVVFKSIKLLVCPNKTYGQSRCSPRANKWVEISIREG